MRTVSRAIYFTIALRIEVEGEPTAAQLAEVEKAAEVLLSNPVIENYVVRVEK